MYYGLSSDSLSQLRSQFHTKASKSQLIPLPKHCLAFLGCCCWTRCRTGINSASARKSEKIRNKEMLNMSWWSKYEITQISSYVHWFIFFIQFVQCASLSQRIWKSYIYAKPCWFWKIWNAQNTFKTGKWIRVYHRADYWVYWGYFRYSYRNHRPIYRVECHFDRLQFANCKYK